MIGENIRKRRMALNLSQADLAKRLGYVNKSSVSVVELDKCDLTVERIKHFAEALECSPLDLIGWNDTLITAYRNASIKDRQTVCFILNIPFIE